MLGAGLQGVATALALSQDGWSVLLLDRAAEPLRGASIRGEGKLHLGYVYANDPGRATASLMVEGALHFSHLLDRWLDQPADWASLRSDPFRYAVLPSSMVPTSDLAEHYAWVAALVAERLSDGLAYAGLTSVAPARLLAAGEDAEVRATSAAFATDEVAVEPKALRALLLCALAARPIRFCGSTTVHEVRREPHGFTVAVEGADGATRAERADVVVNCLWDGRLAVDRTLGIEPDRPWIHRLKYGVHGTVDPGTAPPPSVTFVLGPFGDVVRHASGRIYASWYPSCLVDTSTEVTPPTTWVGATSEDGWTSTQHDVAEATVTALAHHVPRLAGLEVDLVAAGPIVAWGETDIDVPDSELHLRHRIGVHDHDGYLSVDTGKLTTAPLFAEQVAERLRG